MGGWRLQPTVGMYVAEGGFVLYSAKKLEMQLLPDCNGPTTTTFFMAAAIGMYMQLPELHILLPAPSF